MTILWAEQALTGAGWRDAVRVEIEAGRIVGLTAGATPEGERVGILLPAPANLHSHAFQRAMAGMTERRGADATDSFWTWRQLMYRFLVHLTPDDVGAISAFVQMEMLEAGYACVTEFHYLHHGAQGQSYDNPAEMSERVIAAAVETGIGLTLLPVLYRRGGCDGQALGPGQVRFGNDRDGFARLWQAAATALAALPADARIGVAPHSLRAVSPDDLAFAAAFAPDAPIHLHLAEQVAEVEEVRAAYGARPVEWLLANAAVDARWCLIHCTQMQPAETFALAATGAVAGLCPMTEANLGDGIFDGVRYLGAGGQFGIGSDSNIRIALAEELRLLEYTQRLRDRGRAMLARTDRSSGGVLFEAAVRGGAQAAGRDAGRIEVGALADLMALDNGAVDLQGRHGDDGLDAYIFAGDDRMVSEVWSAGRHLVTAGRHRKRQVITARYRATMAVLRGRL